MDSEAVDDPEKKEKKERELGVLGMEGHYAECYPG